MIFHIICMFQENTSCLYYVGVLCNAVYSDVVGLLGQNNVYIKYWNVWVLKIMFLYVKE